MHINNTAVLADDRHSFLESENGVFSFQVTAYTAETIKVRAVGPAEDQVNHPGGTITGISDPVVINLGLLHHFKVEVLSPQTVGVPFYVTVTAQDEWNNTVTNFTGAVTLAQVGGTAGADGPPKIGVHINNTATTADDSYTFVAGDNGVHSFPVTAYTSETITKFAASGVGKTGDSGSVVVSP